MWMHAVFVSPLTATALGSVYVVLRALYPFLLGDRISKFQAKRVFLVTGPAYLIVAFLLGSTVVAAFVG